MSAATITDAALLEEAKRLEAKYGCKVAVALISAEHSAFITSRGLASDVFEDWVTDRHSDLLNDEARKRREARR
jgi:hypothetical protein